MEGLEVAVGVTAGDDRTSILGELPDSASAEHTCPSHVMEQPSDEGEDNEAGDESDEDEGDPTGDEGSETGTSDAEEDEEEDET